MDNIGRRFIAAVLYGLIVGIVVGLLAWVVTELSSIVLDPEFWGTIAGVIAGLYKFLTDSPNRV